MKVSKKNYLLLALSLLVCMCMTGCGNQDKPSTSGNNDSASTESAMDDVGNAVEDVADGIGNAVDDLVGDGGFDNYSDAQKYFMDTMSSYHGDAQFELRDENEKLTDYQEGSKGYHFYLYDTSNQSEGELFGEFYVDATSGMIYRLGEDGTISEYPEKTDTNTTDNTDNNTNNNTNNNTSTRSTGTGNNTGTSGNTTNNNTGNGNSPKSGMTSKRTSTR